MVISVPPYQRNHKQDVKILYIEEEIFSREKLLRFLNRRFSDVYVAIDGKEGFQLFKQIQPDIIIVDINMSIMNGLELIESIRNLNERVQIIVTAANDDPEIFIQSIEYNVNHFILKPIDLEKFLSAIHKSINKIQRGRELSNMDPLTKSYNRFRFEEILSSEIRRSKRYEHPFSIILFDIDHFNHVNQYFGNQRGDEVLATISTIVQQRIRESDIFARWGGDELILLTPETNSQGAVVLAESIRTIIDSITFPQIGSITCSFGIAEYSPSKKKAELIMEAGEALNTSKQNGRNCVTVYKS